MTLVQEPARIRWYVWAEGVRLPRTAQMRGFWGYDVECSCGWGTRSGGATRRYIENEVMVHKLIDHETGEAQ